jgi:hypothetical protein
MGVDLTVYAHLSFSLKPSTGIAADLILQSFSGGDFGAAFGFVDRLA